MAYDVFISYSHRDKVAADEACAVIEATGIRCWIAPRDIPPGAEWAESIVEAIAQVRVMVLIFSNHTNDSPQIRREVERAVSAGVTIMPVRIEDVTPVRALAYFMAGVHWLDALTHPLEPHLNRLAVSIAALLHAADMPVDADKPRGERSERRFVDQRRQRRSLWDYRYPLGIVGVVLAALVGLAVIFWPRPDTSDHALHACLTAPTPDLDNCYGLMLLLAHTDPGNGAVPYFKGEILRYRGRLDDSRAPFYDYLEHKDEHYPANRPDDGTVEVCNTNGTGYCRQRTAWVCHTLANDLYGIACKTTGTPQRLDGFKRADGMLKCEISAYRPGFEQRTATRPLNTTDLAEALVVELKDPARACDTPPAR